MLSSVEQFKSKLLNNKSWLSRKSDDLVTSKTNHDLDKVEVRHFESLYLEIHDKTCIVRAHS